MKWERRQRRDETSAAADISIQVMAGRLSGLR